MGLVAHKATPARVPRRLPSLWEAQPAAVSLPLSRSWANMCMALAASAWVSASGPISSPHVSQHVVAAASRLVTLATSTLSPALPDFVRLDPLLRA